MLLDRLPYHQLQQGYRRAELSMHLLQPPLLWLTFAVPLPARPRLPAAVPLPDRP